MAIVHGIGIVTDLGIGTGLGGVQQPYEVLFLMFFFAANRTSNGYLAMILINQILYTFNNGGRDGRVGSPPS